MGLIRSVAILSLVIVAVIATAFGISSLLRGAQGQSVTQAQAEQFVLNDLRQSSPGADITIINVTSSTLKAGSWDVVVSVVSNATTPCPTFLTEQFDYPAVTLVPSVEDLYTSGCKVYGLANAPSYVISAAPVAITRAYDFGNSTILDYIGAHMNDVVVHARLYTVLNASATPLARQFNDTWLINYSASGAPVSLHVLMDRSGISLLGMYTLNSTAG